MTGRNPTCRDPFPLETTGQTMDEDDTTRDGENSRIGVGDPGEGFRDGEPRDRAADISTSDLDLDDVVLDGEENQGLFDDLLSGEPIFENKEVLRPSYTPHELPHRDDQINRMATILVSALRGETPSNILIYGKTGTGKTASAQFVSQELESTSEKYD
ncbi:MAG: cell division control protein Cdc6, partial [Haloferacaceae archaeon]